MSRLVTICGALDQALPSRYERTFKFSTEIFNTIDTFVVVLGRTHHDAWERMLDETTKAGVKLEVIFDDRAVNAWSSHTDDTSLRQRIIIFEFSFIPDKLNSGDKIV